MNKEQLDKLTLKEIQDYKELGWYCRYSQARQEYRWYGPDGMNYSHPPDFKEKQVDGK